MTRQTKPARELAARALCRHDGNPEDTTFEGKPMWESYLPAADAVLEAIGTPAAEDRSGLRIIAEPKSTR
jgi:hypothetical protein